MQIIDEGRLRFSFPDNTIASKYDDWAFYRQQFNRAFGGTKAVDFIHIDVNQTWLIEVKDYRHNPREKKTQIVDEFAFKVRDTLAGLASAKCNANDSTEKKVARKAFAKNRIRVVLHLEQPSRPSRLYPTRYDIADLTNKLKQKIKAVDAHPRVVDIATMQNQNDMNWTAEGI